MGSISTTILALRHRGKTIFAGDGQVTLNNVVVKHSASKIRRLNDGNVLVGFAGSAADGLALVERFEGKLKEHQGNLRRSAVELAKAWRQDKYLRRLEALMVVGSIEELYLLSGAGDIISPDDDIIAIGSGGNFALSAARAILRYNSELDGTEIAKTAMEIAASLCPFTNEEIVLEVLERK